MSKKGLPYHKHTGFSVPEGYFETLESRLRDRIAREDEIGLPESTSPFKVPDSYFERFSDRLHQRLEEQERPVKVIPLAKRKMVSYVAGIAAVLAVVFGSLLYSPAESVDFNDLDLLTVENYLLESIKYSPEENQLLKEGDLSYSPPGDNVLDQEAVMEYLQENVDDPSLLLNDE